MDIFISNAATIYPKINWNTVINNIEKYATIDFNDQKIRTYMNEYAFTNEKELNPFRKIKSPPQLSKDLVYYSLNISIYPKSTDPKIDFHEFLARIIVFHDYEEDSPCKEYIPETTYCHMFAGSFEIINHKISNSWRAIMKEIGVDMKTKFLEANGSIMNIVCFNWDGNGSRLIIEDPKNYYILIYVP